MTRISSSTYQLQWLQSFRRQQADLAATQHQVSSGRRISTAADDPAGAAQAALLQQGLDRIANYSANGEVARRRLSLEETVLTEAGDVLNRLRELVIQAANDTQTTANRENIAAEAEELLSSLVDIANSQDGEGRYLFAGNLVKVRPFVEGATVDYHGDDGTRLQRIGDTRTVPEGDPGSAVFMNVPSGNGRFTVSADAGNEGHVSWNTATVSDAAAWVPDTYTVIFTAADAWEVRDGSDTVVAGGSYQPGSTLGFGGIAIEFRGVPVADDRFVVAEATPTSVFETARGVVEALRTPSDGPSGRALLTSRLNSSLENLDRGLDHLSGVRSQVGARLGAIGRQLDGNADQGLQLSQSLSTVRDLDYATAISRLELQLTALEAAQRTYARTRAVSLFDFI